MKECDKGCRLHESIDMILNHLVDASYVSLRSKPSDSLSLFYHMLKEYYGVEDDDRVLLELLFRTEKFFFLVSNTPSEYLPFKNKSNRKSTIIEPLSFLKRFEAYHYNNVYAIYKTGFEKYFYNHNKEYFN